MRKSKILRSALALTLSAMCLTPLALTGCASGSSDGDSSEGLTLDTGLTGGIAATVNGTEIEEDEITRTVNNIRIQNELEEDSAFGEYLANYGDTPESLRDNILQSYINRELLLQFGDEIGASASQEEIDAQVTKMRSKYSTDEAWQEALEKTSYENEDEYKDSLNYSIRYKKASEYFNDNAGDSTAEVIEELNNSKEYIDGAKRSSHILFDLTDKTTASEVLQKINNGELDFAEAAREYSKDNSAENGGDVGWNVVNQFVDEYTEALDALEKDQVSDLVKSEYGYHIIKCTDVYVAPEEITSLDQVPEEIVTQVQTNVNSEAGSKGYEEWLKGKQESSDVVINPMPENVPYNIDMTPYESEEEQEAIDENAEEALTEDVVDESAELDGAAADASAAEAASEEAQSEVSEGEGSGETISDEPETVEAQ